MQNQTDNMIYVVAKALAESPSRECFLVIDDLIEMAPQLPGVRAGIMKIMEASTKNALHTMILSYYKLEGCHDTTFRDGSETIIDLNGIAIHVSAKQMDSEGSVYRLLFTRLDAAALHDALHRQLKTLTTRVERLERARSF